MDAPQRIRYGLLLAAGAFLPLRLWGMDAELERLKAAANEVHASLALRQSAQKQADKDFQNSEFLLDTAVMKYRLRYKTFPGAEAAQNPKLLNDWGSGYGMLAPHEFWYHNGFLDAALVDNKAGSVYMFALSGVVRELAAKGQRVGYDLVFSNAQGSVVVRTVALAGREELFVSVCGRLNAGAAGVLSVTFRGYPLGFSGPFDRWLHGDGQDIQNAGSERKTAALKLDVAPWLLLADHKLDPEGKRAGLLGLIYDRKALTSASLTTSNYSLDVRFEGPGDQEQRFIVYTFGPKTWQAARQHLAEVKDAGELLDRAFKGLGPAFEAEAATK
jgi:hypothetical protein